MMGVRASSNVSNHSDGLGGVIKSFVYRDVCGSEKIIRNAAELYDYCSENLTAHNVENGKPMLNRLLFYISSKEMTSTGPPFLLTSINQLRVL